MAVGGTFGTPGGSRLAIAVFDQVGRTLGAVGKADAHQGLDLGEFTELAELIDAHVVGIPPPPVVVVPGHAQIAVANGYVLEGVNNAIQV